MNQNYIVDKLTLSDLTKTGKIVIPSFQRGIVWNKEHRKDFIETVKSGDPFGVVLVSQARPNDPYILIDGLQRLSTLKAYMSNPLEFVDENDKFIDKEKLHSFFEQKYYRKGMQLPREEKLDKEKRSFLKKMIILMKEKESTPRAADIWRLMSDFLQIPSSAPYYFDLYDLFEKFYSSFIENLQLPDIIIHAIVYQGPQERLPLVFEHLNTTSVTLSKYEVFSSQWPSNKIIIHDEAIVKNVWSKYSKLKSSSSFDVDTTEESIRNEGITLFEYCFAFSEILNDENATYSFMFSKTKKSTDPTGFDILALACGLPANKAESICKDEYLGGTATGAFLVDLKNAIIDSVNIVSRNIDNWTHDLKNSAIKNTSLYQIYHMVITVFTHIYTLDLKTKEVIKRDDLEALEWMKKFDKYAYKWYLFHRLSDFWNDNRQVSDLKRLLDGTESNDFYVTNISRENWNKIIFDYVERTRSNAISRNIENDTKLILNYLYKLMIKEDRNREEYFKKTDGQGNEIIFDIEHIVPVDKFKNFDEDLSISTLGNLCYLPVKDNRSKRDKTIYEYAGDRPSLTYNIDFLFMINYPTREELEFIDCPLNQFKPAFERFIKNREKEIIEKFIDLLMKF